MTAAAPSGRLPDAFCVTMLCPGAAWQCALVRRSLQWRFTVQAADRYDGTCWRAERACFHPGGWPLSPEGLPDIKEKAFRLVTTQQHRRLFLSGSVEPKEADNFLWDIRLDPLCESLYRAEGRVVIGSRELLFPSASAFLAVQTQFDGACAAYFAASRQVRSEPRLFVPSGETAFRFALHRGRQAVTQFGAWQNDQGMAGSRLPGFCISVIKM